MRRRVALTGSMLRGRSIAFKGAIAIALREKVWPLFEARKVRPVIHHVFPAVGAAQAHTLMESGEYIGKITLQW
jgi:NADPH2:quinone reductase